VFGRIGKDAYQESLNMRSTISEKGQVTVPKPLRERLGIRPGDQLEFSEEHGRLVARKTSERNPVEEVYGILELKQSTDEMLSTLRGEPDAV
jgi:AbrB family looped-hinge helix DNA binding protein